MSITLEAPVDTRFEFGPGGQVRAYHMNQNLFSLHINCTYRDPVCAPELGRVTVRTWEIGDKAVAEQIFDADGRVLETMTFGGSEN